VNGSKSLKMGLFQKIIVKTTNILL